MIKYRFYKGVDEKGLLLVNYYIDKGLVIYKHDDCSDNWLWWNSDFWEPTNVFIIILKILNKAL